MKVVTSKQMAEIDKTMIEKLGVPGVVLMENAGAGTVSAIEDAFPDLRTKKVFIVAGKGNNGGDGFVIARHLNSMGAEVCTTVLGDMDEIEGDAKTNLDILLNSGVPVELAPDLEGWEDLSYHLYDSDIVVDALFGTGLEGAVRGYYREVIQDINTSQAFTVSVDIPSGLSGEHSEIKGEAVVADLTATFGLPKYAHIFPPAEDLVGELVVVDISIPEDAYSHIKTEFIDDEYAAPRLKTRLSESHKGTYGHLLGIAGSRGKPGAASLIGTGALKSGAGLSTLYVPSVVSETVNSHKMELMTEPPPEGEENFLSVNSLDKTLKLASQKDAVALGPGLGRKKDTEKFIKGFISECQTPIVVDADGINAYEKNVRKLKSDKTVLIATPHPGELARLYDVSTSEIQDDRLGYARKLAGDNGIYVVLKGYRTIICSPGGETLINSSGNPGMATAGTGDVLTGIIAGMLAQGYDPETAASLGVFFHGKAGDLAAEDLGYEGITAGNLVDYLPVAFETVWNNFYENQKV